MHAAVAINLLLNKFEKENRDNLASFHSQTPKVNKGSESVLLPWKKGKRYPHKCRPTPVGGRIVRLISPLPDLVQIGGGGFGAKTVCRIQETESKCLLLPFDRCFFFFLAVKVIFFLHLRKWWQGMQYY